MMMLWCCSSARTEIMRSAQWKEMMKVLPSIFDAITKIQNFVFYLSPSPVKSHR
jgi:hypothetical protein